MYAAANTTPRPAFLAALRAFCRRRAARADLYAVSDALTGFTASCASLEDAARLLARHPSAVLTDADGVILAR